MKIPQFQILFSNSGGRWQRVWLVGIIPPRHAPPPPNTPLNSRVGLTTKVSFSPSQYSSRPIQILRPFSSEDCGGKLCWRRRVATRAFNHPTISPTILHPSVDPFRATIEEIVGFSNFFPKYTLI